MNTSRIGAGIIAAAVAVFMVSFSLPAQADYSSQALNPQGMSKQGMSKQGMNPQDLFPLSDDLRDSEIIGFELPQN